MIELVCANVDPDIAEGAVGPVITAAMVIDHRHRLDAGRERVEREGRLRV